MIENGLNALILMAIILGCAIIAWIIYMVFWKAWFYPIDKQIKIDRERATINREFNKIEDKQARLEDEIEILRSQYAEVAVKSNDLENDIKRRQTLLKEYDKEIKEFRAWKEKGSPKASDIPEDEEELKKNKELEALDQKIEATEKPSKKSRNPKKKPEDNI